jgi:hypothetical protein
VAERHGPVGPRREQLPTDYIVAYAELWKGFAVIAAADPQTGNTEEVPPMVYAERGVEQIERHLRETTQ